MLSEKTAPSYWEERAKKFDKRAVGFDSRQLEEQEINYSLRRSFIFNHLNSSTPTLDYGCGVGRYAKYFRNYMGCDLTKQLLDIAGKENPNTAFFHLKEPWINEDNALLASRTEQIFTATVLQHCDDELVAKIIKSFSHFPLLHRLCFYEKNNGDVKPHVVSRNSKEYYDLVNCAGFFIKNSESYTHSIHGELHTLSKFTIG